MKSSTYSLILNCALICAMVTSESTWFKAHRQPFLTDIIITRNIVFNSKGTPIACLLDCLSNEACVSVSYHTTTTLCLGISAGYVQHPVISIGDSSVGWNYIFIQDYHCKGIDGYVYSRQWRSCYKLHQYNSSLNLIQYNQQCTEEFEGAELMKIDSSEKQQHIISFLEQFALPQWIVIQGQHSMSETPWRYNDGSIITYFNWHPSQPDDSELAPVEYIAMTNDDYTWHDVYHNYNGAFLCEKLF